MSEKIKCFWLNPTNVVRISLRRYSPLAVKCPLNRDGKGPHDASTFIEDRAFEIGQDVSGRYEHADERWPTVCKCGYVFHPVGDVWQVLVEAVMERKDNNERMLLSDAGPGAMWDSVWLKGIRGYKSPDGHCITLRTPDGDWVVDGPSENGNGWTRTGDVPDITATPSIVVNSYHGYLREGYLEDA